MRRVLVVFCAMVVAAGLGLPAHGAIGPGGTFVDDDGNPHEGNIEAIFAAQITKGCNEAGDRFCPKSAVSREQMAAFLARALALPEPEADHFGDDTGSIFEADINRIFEAGITVGCTATTYCPGQSITREQMAAFLVRAYGYQDRGGADRFSDDNNSPFEAEIEKLAVAGITLGCGASTYCPLSPVLREEMATFLARAEGLEPIVPPARCTVLPLDNIWNRRIDSMPVHSRSAAYVASIGSGNLHPDFGSGVWPPGSDSSIGIPFTTVDASQPLVPIIFTAYGDESDPGPYPVPATAPIEGGPSGDGDRHVLVVDQANCHLYELYRAFPNPDGSWDADSAASYDLRSNALRPAGWTSADAAGLPIYPGLVRYDEVAAGVVTHAIRFTAPSTQRAYVWPARHFASSSSNLDLPPMGQRFRLKAGYDISGFDPQVQVILTGMKQYGLMLADNGSGWFISGAPDPRWDNDILGQLKTVPASDFEAVDVSSLMISAESGASK